MVESRSLNGSLLTQVLPLLQGESHPLEEPRVPDVIHPADCGWAHGALVPIALGRATGAQGSWNGK